MKNYVKYFALACCFLFVLLSVVNAQTKDAQEHITKGKKLKENKEYKAAIEEFNMAIKAENDNGMTYWERAVCYENLENYKDALSDIDMAISYLKANKEWLYKLYFDKGLYEYELHDYKNANADFTNSLDINPKYGKVYYYRAVSYKDCKEYQLAINDCNKALELYSESKESLPTIYNMKGIAEDFLGDYKNSIEDFSKAIELHPKFGRAYINRGDVYKEIKEMGSAISDYNHSIPLFDKDKITLASIYQKIGNCDYQEFHYKEAIADQTKAILLDPKYGLAYWYRGASYYRNNQIKESLADFKIAFSLYADDSASLSSLHEYVGEIYQSVKDNSRAIEEFNLALAANPKSAVSYYQKGVSLYNKSEYKASIDAFSTAITLYEKDTSYLPNCYNYRGYVKYQIDDYKGAIEDYTKAIAIRPNYGNAIWNRGDAYQYNKDYKHSIEDYTTALSLYQNDSASLATLYCSRASTKINNETYLGAIEDCNLAIKFKPDYAVAFSNKGTAFKDSGLYKEAITEYRKALDLYQNNKDKSAVMYENMGYCNNESGQYKQAIEDFTHAISNYSKYALAYWSRGYSYSKLKDDKTAISDYNIAISLYGSDSVTLASIHKDIGLVYDDKKEYKAAIEEYKIALKYNPKFGLAYHEIGAAHSRLKDYKAGIEDFNSAIALYKDDSIRLGVEYDWRGFEKYKMDDYPNAVIDYNIALKYDPKNDDALLNLANSLYEDVYIDKALEIYAKLLPTKKDTDDIADIHEWRFFCYYDKKEYSKALDEISIAVQLKDKEFYYYYRKGKALRKLNRNEEAIKNFTKAMELDTTRKSTQYIFSLYYIGEKDSAINLYKKKVADEKDSMNIMNYTNSLGVLYSLNNQPKEAMECVKKTIEMGFPLRKIYYDQEYDNIKQTPEFIALVSNKVKK